MSYEVHWTPARADEFIDKACLTGDMAAIIRLRPYRYGRVKDVMLLGEAGFNMSLDTYDSRIKELKALYDAVQPESDILPPRQRSKMDAIKMAGWKNNTKTF